MFEGLLSPWHLLIIALALFIVIGPKAMADRWKNLSETVSRLGDAPDGPSPSAAADEPAPPAERRSPLARRIGRRLTRRRRQRSGR
jgi:Sec-independent protein translocase protein TatA